MILTLPTDTLINTAGAYLVGGSVRDMICGRAPIDYDIAVAGDPQGYAERLAAKLKGRVVTIGKPAFPLYRIVQAPLAVDVTPIKGDSIAADLLDRDFTINALACDLKSGKIIDTTGGMPDLKQGVVRMVSEHAFGNDPVRMLRAHRMAAHFGFDIAAATSRAITDQAQSIQTSAGERIWAELLLILSGPNSFDTLSQMTQDQLLFAILPELAPLKGCHQSEPHHLDVYEHTLLAYQSLEGLLAQPTQYLSEQAATFLQTLSIESQALLKLALLLHDMGKPGQRTIDEDGKIHFYGHPVASVHLARTILKRLCMSKQQANWIERIIGNHSRPHDLFLLNQSNKLTSKAVGKLLRQCGKYTPLIILHAMADNLGKNLSHQKQAQHRLSFFNQLLETYFETAVPKGAPPLLSGHDLMSAFDLSPSPLLGTLLNGVEERRLAGSLSDEKEALEWVERYLRGKGLLP